MRLLVQRDQAFTEVDLLRRDVEIDRIGRWALLLEPVILGGKAYSRVGAVGRSASGAGDGEWSQY
jgi:hypothetical protein